MKVMDTVVAAISSGAEVVGEVGSMRGSFVREQVVLGRWWRLVGILVVLGRTNRHHGELAAARAARSMLADKPCIQNLHKLMTQGHIRECIHGGSAWK